MPPAKAQGLIYDFGPLTLHIPCHNFYATNKNYFSLDYIGRVNRLKYIAVPKNFENNNV